MAGQSLTFEQLSESIAQDVGTRLGVSSFDSKNIVKVLGDIKYLLTKIIDVNGSVQSANKFPNILTNSFKELAKKLEDSSKNLVLKTEEQKHLKVEEPKPLKVEDTTLKIEEQKPLKVEDTKLKVEDTKLKVEDTKLKVEEPKPLKVEDTKLKVEEQKPLKVEDTKLKVEEPKPLKVEDTKLKVEEPKPLKVEEQKPLKVEEQANNKPLDSSNFIDKQIKALNDAFKSLKIKKDSFDPEKTKLQQVEEPKPILFAGFTPDGLKSIQENLPKIIEEGTERLVKALVDSKSQTKDKKELGVEFPGMGIVKGALGVLSIVGGIFTLLYGLQTDGPFKGLAKLAGKGMLEIGKILTAPLKEFTSTLTNFLIDLPLQRIKVFGNFIKNIFSDVMKAAGFIGRLQASIMSPLTNAVKSLTNRLLEVPTKLFKSFSSSISNAFKSVTSAGLDLATKTGKTLLAPVSQLTKFISEKFLSIPLNLFKSFKGSILGIFEKVGGSSIIKTGLGKLTNFIPTMLRGLVPILKKIPIVGTLISLSYAISRFKSGDYVGGGIDILSGIAAIIPGVGTAMSIGLDALNAFLDIKSGGATGKQQGTKIDLLKGIGDWIGEKIVKLPIIGPLVKATQYLAAREWKKGLKQLAYAVPLVDAVAAFLGDEEASDTSKAFAGAVKEVNWSEIGSWLFKTFKNVPIIGPLMKAVENFTSGEYLKGLKQLAYINPVFEAIGGMFGDSEAGTMSTAIGDWGVDLVTDLSKWIIDSLSEMINLDAIKDSILGAAKGVWESRPTWLGGKGTDSPTTLQETAPPSPASSATSSTPIPRTRGEAAAARDKQQVKPVADAKIKPDGGMVVSSPKEGSLFQLSKNDGIVAAPFESPDKNIKQPQSNSFAKAETILEKIANNTGSTNQGLSNLINGFNNLAKALKESGTISQAPVVINNTRSSPQTSKPPDSQLASLGNPDIGNFRLGVVEASRFVAV